MMPSPATNAVGTKHTLTITVAPINGTIDAGTYTATATIISGPGTPVTQTCTYLIPATSCTVVITSATTGTSVVRATSTFKLSGQSVTRTTTLNQGPGGSGDAS